MAMVWLINGLLCKVMHMVPRHELIVARILGPKHAALLTILIGISEILLAIWILSGIYRRLNAWTQIFLIFIMNMLEYFVTPDLLLWGKYNAVFAGIFILIIYTNELTPMNNLIQKP